ncbi:unannotated protein [freshwater metagenome]|uniref:Unannotated protein n=1 Tax=freshwater metagenome TaxID=449393 RepID=A0A6J7DWW8_9ZZZZ
MAAGLAGSSSQKTADCSERSDSVDAAVGVSEKKPVTSERAIGRLSKDAAG